MATATQTTKKTRSRKSKQCRTKDCIKRAVSYGYCKACSDERTKKKASKKEAKPNENGNGNNGNTETVHDTLINELPALTEVELLKVRALDTEVRNSVLGIQIANLHIEDAQRKFNAFVDQKQTERSALNSTLKTKQRERDRVLDAAAKRYNLDPKALSYDDVTGELKDLRDELKPSGTNGN